MLEDMTLDSNPSTQISKPIDNSIVERMQVKKFALFHLLLPGIANHEMRSEA